MTLLHPPHPPTPPSVNNNETCNVATSSNQATSSRIQHHPLTWHDVITSPPPPHPPFCKQQRNLQRSNIFQSSNIFQDSTSSNALHMTLLHPPQHHPTHFTWRYYTPPHPPICIQERPFWYSIKAEGSSKLRGTPSLEPIYIYTVYITLGHDKRHCGVINGNMGRPTNKGLTIWAVIWPTPDSETTWEYVRLLKLKAAIFQQRLDKAIHHLKFNCWNLTWLHIQISKPIFLVMDFKLFSMMPCSPEPIRSRASRIQLYSSCIDVFPPSILKVLAFATCFEFSRYYVCNYYL